MHYYLCPRCNFKIAGKKRLCTTCGYRMPKPDSTDDSASGAKNAKRGSIFSRFFGVNSDDNKQTEGGQEKPALSQGLPLEDRFDLVVFLFEQKNYSLQQKFVKTKGKHIASLLPK